ncbi:23 kDa integral membrane protein-like [Poeciliopsis prolifica]|uniref:23 kDa integral membrane protein-like n=1 Tax=Poeciliopsis prolifica TaxID=188132 RepID=UPI00241465AF|nr:23 kDa integral membrane protein-like [Poeciliopsis prolifica]
MGEINQCLKIVFIVFNSLFTCFGGMLIYGLIKLSSSNYEMEGIDTPSIIWVWVFAICTVLISLLGAHAARTESKCGLKLFAALMGIAMLLMLFFGIAGIVLKNKEMEKFRDPETAKELLKDNEKKKLLETLQGHLHCCGWSGVEDWGPDVPSSCRCTSSYGAGCTSSPQGSSVYSKSCGEIVGDYVEYFMKIGLCIFFGFAFVAMMGLIISANMINQISRHDRAGTPAFAMGTY